METVWDWVTIAIFAGLVVLFMQRSTAETPSDSIWQYLVAAVGCAGANYLGNEGETYFAIAAIVATLAYIHWQLRPFGGRPPR